MLILYGFISLFIATIWVFYLRQIDIFKKVDFKLIILAFVLGSCSTQFLLGANWLIDHYLGGYNANQTLLHDLVYSIAGIGLIEEFAKLIPFLIILKLFNSRLTEPIDYLVVIASSALGFASLENILYFYNHGPEIIDGRSVLSTLSHIIDSSIVAYGFIYQKYYRKKFDLSTSIVFFLFAAVSHGIYDFFLIYESPYIPGGFVMVLYFFLTVSFFAVILNNSLNLFPHFTYKKSINSNKLASRMIEGFAVVFVLQFLLLAFFKSVPEAVGNLIYNIFAMGLIVGITSIRLSRFKLIKDQWKPLRIELPFKLGANTSGVWERRSGYIKIEIKGASFNEFYINKYYKEHLTVKPITFRNSYLNQSYPAYIEEKYFLKNEDSYYCAEYTTPKSSLIITCLSQRRMAPCLLQKNTPLWLC